MNLWNPWRGCHKCSEGCKFCYIHKGDFKRKVDTDNIVKTKDIDLPIRKNDKGEYIVKSNTLVYLCFSTDFLIEEADTWRIECLNIIKQRSDLKFMFLTKRIDRLEKVIPNYYEYDNLIVGCTVENKKNVDYKLKIFDNLKIKHKMIILQPLIEEVDISNHLDNIELVVVGGESDKQARPLNYDWVLKIRNACIKKNVNFEFRQCGTNFIKDNKLYILDKKNLCKFAKNANINFYKEDLWKN